MKFFLKFNRNVYLLGIAQVIGMSAIALIFLVSGFVSVEIAPSASLSTLPLALSFLGLAVFTIPAPLLMKKIGRKKGFILSAVISALATGLAALAIGQNNFFLFSLAIFFLGTHGAFIGQYRFAVLECVPKQEGSRAVGLILMAAVLSGLLGPEIAKQTRDVFSLPQYAGSFIFLALLFLLVAVLFLFFKDVKEERSQEVLDEDRPLLTIIRQPVFFIAAAAAAVGYGVMVFIMSATPLQLHTVSGFSLDETAFVLQSHIVAMFLPSFFTGMLIQKFGIFKILISGLLGLLLAVFIGINAQAVFLYWFALIILGVGWNFLFMGSTILLPQSYTLAERFKVQGVNDFAFVVSQMIGSFFAGSLLFSSGWINLNLFTLPFIVLTFALFLFYRRQLYARLYI